MENSSWRLDQIERRLDAADVSGRDLQKMQGDNRVTVAEIKRDMRSIREDVEEINRNVNRKLDSLTVGLRWATGTLITLIGIAGALLVKGG